LKRREQVENAKQRFGAVKILVFIVKFYLKEGTWFCLEFYNLDTNEWKSSSLIAKTLRRQRKDSNQLKEDEVLILFKGTLKF